MFEKVVLILFVESVCGCRSLLTVSSDFRGRNCFLNFFVIIDVLFVLVDLLCLFSMVEV